MKRHAIITCGLMMLFSIPTWAKTQTAPEALHTTQNPAYQLQDKVVLGRLENVYFHTIDALKSVPFKGKIDTGADTTSMHADNIHVTSTNPRYRHLKDSELMEYVIRDQGGIASGWWKKDFSADKRNLQLFVTFSLLNPYSGENIAVKHSLDRISVVKSRSSKHPIYRPVINVPLTVGGKEVNTDVSLTDRGNFSAPILIGKNFLRHNAWVMAGYNYLQELPKAIVVGKKETMHIGQHAFETRFSLTNSHSILDAKHIKLHNDQVSFTTKDSQGHEFTLSYPLAGWARFGDVKRMQVYIPVKLSETVTIPLLVYLKDRSDNDTPLSIGLNNLDQYFVIKVQDEYLLDKPLRRFTDIEPDALVLSNDESLPFEGSTITVQTSFGVYTSMLKVSKWQLIDSDSGPQVLFSWKDKLGVVHQSRAPWKKNIIVGKERRPVVELNLSTQGLLAKQEVALSLLTDGEAPASFTVGDKDMPPRYLSTRSSQLLRNLPIVAAGYIETVTVEGLHFPAKLDTGADMTSMNAQNIRYFEQDGHKMVRFDYENGHGHKQTFERKVVATIKVRAKAGEQANVRPVVLMTVQLGNLKDTIRVNLQDRARFNYSMILGENFLRDGVVVSSDQQYLLTKSNISHQ